MVTGESIKVKGHLLNGNNQIPIEAAYATKYSLSLKFLNGYNLSQGFERNIEELKGNQSFSFLNGDVRDLDFFKKAANNIDFLVHLAAFKIPRYGNALDTLLINTEGTKNALDISTAKRFWPQ